MRPKIDGQRRAGLARTSFLVLLMGGFGCGDGQHGPVPVPDAAYDPPLAADSFQPLHESALVVAQTFTVESAGPFEEFEIALTQGPGGNRGMLRIDIRPLMPSGEPESDDSNALITPIDVDTMTLPEEGIEEFTTWKVAGPDVNQGEEYAIVVRFEERLEGDDDKPIAYVLGRFGDGYSGGTAWEDPDGMGFVSLPIDAFFRTYLLRIPRRDIRS